MSLTSLAFVSNGSLLDGVADTSAYRLMLTIRRFEEKLGQFLALGVIQDTFSLTTGREAIAAAVSAVAQSGEPLVSAPAPYGSLLCRGASEEDLFTRIITGAALDVASEDVALEATSLAALTSALTLARSRAAVFCWISADDSKKAAILDHLKSAGVEKAPLVVLVECPISADTEYEAIATQANRSGIAVERAESCDAGMIMQAVRKAAEAARAGEGPTLIVIRTAAFQGHAADAAQRAAGFKPRGREDNDPLARMRAALVADGGISETDLKTLEKDVRDRIAAAASAARRAEDRQRDAV